MCTVGDNRGVCISVSGKSPQGPLGLFFFLRGIRIRCGTSQAMVVGVLFSDRLFLWRECSLQKLIKTFQYCLRISCSRIYLLKGAKMCLVAMNTGIWLFLSKQMGNEKAYWNCSLLAVSNCFVRLNAFRPVHCAFVFFESVNTHARTRTHTKFAWHCTSILWTKDSFKCW